MRFIAPFLVLALAVGGLGLAGCSQGVPTNQLIPQAVLTDLNAVTASAQNAVTALSAGNPPVLTAAQAAQVDALLADARTVLATLSAADAANPANASKLLAATNDLNSVLLAVANLPGIPPQYSQIFVAISVVLPIVEVVIEQIDPSLVMPTPAPVPTSSRMHAAPTMNLHNARVVLGEGG